MENTQVSNFENKEPIKEKNTPPFWTTRIASGLIDCGLLIFLLFIFISVFQISPIGDSLESYKTEMVYIQKDYALKPLIAGSDETYAYKVYIDESNKDQYSGSYEFTDEEDKIYVLAPNPTQDKDLQAKLEEALAKALEKDKKYTNASFNYRLVDYGINMLAVSISEAILILIIPLINKRRVTIGQYLAGQRMVNAKLPTPARWWKIIIRYFWVVIMEIALPWLSIMSIYSLIIVPFVLYVISLFNKNKRTLRDYVSSTRLINNNSYEPISSKED